MNVVRISSAALLLMLTRPAAAEDSGRFLVRLGRDTTSFERYVRGADRLEVWQVGRSPRVLNRHFVMTYEQGVLTRLDATVTPPGAEAPVQTIVGTSEPDSFRTTIRNATGPEQSFAVAFARGGLVVPYSSPWTSYEAEIVRLVASKSDSVRRPLYYLGAPGTNWLVLQRLGRDSVVLANDRNDVFHVGIDRAGRVLGVVPVSGTGMISLERHDQLDVDALAAAFAAREKSGAGMGTLSPRDTVRAEIAGAALWIDYGRPLKRGRTIFGNVVPFGQIWRTGANAATQFHTDLALDFSGTAVPAGTYTLWTVPTPGGWQVVLNSQTGQWGTEHDPTKDVAKFNLALERLSSPVERLTLSIEPSRDGGVLRIEWDDRRGSASFHRGR